MWNRLIIFKKGRKVTNRTAGSRRGNRGDSRRRYIANVGRRCFRSVMSGGCCDIRGNLSASSTRRMGHSRHYSSSTWRFTRKQWLTTHGDHHILDNLFQVCLSKQRRAMINFGVLQTKKIISISISQHAIHTLFGSEKNINIVASTYNKGNMWFSGDGDGGCGMGWTRFIF